MKCDVCQTQIPLGSDECPNCGYKIRENHVQTFDASGVTHEHIRVPKAKPTKRTQKTDYNQHRKKGRTMRTVVIFIVVIISVVTMVCGGIIIPIMMSSDIFNDNESYHTYEDMTFTDMVNEGIDKNDTISHIQDYAESLKTFLNKQGISDLSENEYCSAFGDRLIANYHVNGSKNDILYSVEVTFTSDEGLSNRGLIISYSSEKSMRKGNVLFSKEDVNAIGDYLDISNAYDILNNSRTKMKKDKDNENRYVYSDYDDLSIYLSEEYYDRKEPYYFHYYSVQKR